MNFQTIGKHISNKSCHCPYLHQNRSNFILLFMYFYQNHPYPLVFIDFVTLYIIFLGPCIGGNLLQQKWVPSIKWNFRPKKIKNKGNLELSKNLSQTDKLIKLIVNMYFGACVNDLVMLLDKLKPYPLQLHNTFWWSLSLISISYG